MMIEIPITETFLYYSIFYGTLIGSFIYVMTKVPELSGWFSELIIEKPCECLVCSEGKTFRQKKIQSKYMGSSLMNPYSKQPERPFLKPPKRIRRVLKNTATLREIMGKPYPFR